MKAMGLFDFLNQMPEDDDWDYEPKQRMSAEETQETFDYLKNHPLFMDKMPDDITGNPMLEALQAMQYDDTPYNIAQNLLENGNIIMKTKAHNNYFLKEALKRYSDGIHQECGDTELSHKLLSNRALVQYKLKNYKAAIQDCKWAIELKPDVVKPYYRCAQCLYQVMYFSECAKMCDAGLQLSKEPELVALKKETELQLDRLARENIKEQEQQEVFRVCRAKGIRLAPAEVSLPPDYNPKKISLESKDPPMLTVPVLLTYPEFGQRDFIQYAEEQVILGDLLTTVFYEPLPWDLDHRYQQDQLEIYIQNDDKQYVKLKQTATILQIMKGWKITVKDFIELIIVSEGKYRQDRFRNEYNLIE